MSVLTLITEMIATPLTLATDFLEYTAVAATNYFVKADFSTDVETEDNSGYIILLF